MGIAPAFLLNTIPSSALSHTGGTMALLDVTQPGWGARRRPPTLVSSPPVEGRCPDCRGRGTIQYMYGRHGGANGDTCGGDGKVGARKEHETYWWHRS